MTLWIDTNNTFHDDANGAALSLPSWPQGMTIATPAQLAAIAAAQDAAQAALPNPIGFETGLQTLFGGTVGWNTVLTKYPLITRALATSNWANIQALILDAHAKSIITPAQYASIQGLVTANNINNVVLP
jgi:hypothetical protein